MRKLVCVFAILHIAMLTPIFAQTDDFFKPFYERTAENGCTYELRNGQLGSQNRFFVLEIRDNADDETTLMVCTESYRGEFGYAELRAKALCLMSRVFYGEALGDILDICRLYPGCELETYGTDVDSDTGRPRTFIQYFCDSTDELTKVSEDYFHYGADYVRGKYGFQATAGEQPFAPLSAQSGIKTPFHLERRTPDGAVGARTGNLATILPLPL